MKLSPRESLAKLTDANKLFLELFKHGTLSVEIYRPHKIDHQKPHSRDEVYVVISGTGQFICGEELVEFEPGDFLFVPAGREHRFQNFTDDFSTWVFFYGPEGGEAAS
jgi:mannose-6-phosphate isomerase-like protein (cupin superfamily)